MRISIKIAIGALVLAAVAAGTFNTGSVMAAKGEAAIEKRLKFYRNDMLKPFLAIKKFVSDGVARRPKWKRMPV